MSVAKSAQPVSHWIMCSFRQSVDFLSFFFLLYLVVYGRICSPATAFGSPVAVPTIWYSPSSRYSMGGRHTRASRHP